MTTQATDAGGFSLIEFFLVLATATILLATVENWLDDYRVRSHVTEALQTAETAKSRIVMTCASDRALETLSNEMIAHTFPYSPYVQSITISGSCEEPEIVLQTINTGLFVEPMLVIYGDLSGDVANWSCTSSGMQADVPARCRGI